MAFRSMCQATSILAEVPSRYALSCFSYAVWWIIPILATMECWKKGMTSMNETSRSITKSYLGCREEHLFALDQMFGLNLDHWTASVFEWYPWWIFELIVDNFANLFEVSPTRYQIGNIKIDMTVDLTGQPVFLHLEWIFHWPWYSQLVWFVSKSTVISGTRLTYWLIWTCTILCFSKSRNWGQNFRAIAVTEMPMGSKLVSRIKCQTKGETILCGCWW